MRDGWVETSLGEISKDGLFGDGDWVESKDQDPSGDYRLLQLADIGDGIFLDKSDRWMNEEQFRRLGCTRLEANDLLIARMPEPIGRACLLPESLPVSATVVDVAIVRTGNENLQKILALIVNSPEFRNEAFSLLTGTTRQRISRGNLSKITFWLPPLPEQKRIVDLISSVDAYIGALRQQLEIVKKTRNAVLFELLGGTSDKDTKPLIELAKLQRGHDLPTQDRVEGLVPVVASNGVVGFHNTHKANRPGVVTGRSGTIGKVIYIETDYWPLNTTLYVVDFKGNNPKFVALVLETLNLENYAGGSTVPSLDRNVLSHVPVPCPNIEEQQRVVEIIQSFEQNIVNSELAIVKARNLRAGLLNDLLSGKHEIPASYDKVIGAA